MTIIDEEPSLANEQQRRRDSLRFGYVPPAHLVVDPSLAFHTDADGALDPVTFEVIRSKLWNLNVDHGDTIRRVSGSSIVVEGYDFNCAVTTELGDAVTLSPYSMFFAGFADEIIKWTLEHRSMNVGIRDGDLFLQDDPWVGSNHQMDTAVYGPVFVDGKLFAWLFNCVHQREIGGSTPGGFIQDARDVYTEPSFMPPIKLAEHGVMREDVVDLWTRRSRLPELMALELNSQVAGFNTARRRIVELLDRYGARAVKGAMNKMIDDTARVVGARLSPPARRHLARRALRRRGQPGRPPPLQAVHELREARRPAQGLQRRHRPGRRLVQRDAGRVPGLGAERAAAVARLRPVPLRGGRAAPARLRVPSAAPSTRPRTPRR